MGDDLIGIDVHRDSIPPDVLRSPRSRGRQTSQKLEGPLSPRRRLSPRISDASRAEEPDSKPRSFTMAKQAGLIYLSGQMQSTDEPFRHESSTRAA
jgi:hypothetical protein